jgi:hypothetical protein
VVEVTDVVDNMMANSHEKNKEADALLVDGQINLHASEVSTGTREDTAANAVGLGEEAIVAGNILQEWRHTGHRNTNPRQLVCSSISSCRKAGSAVKRAYVADDYVPSDDSLLDPDFNIEDILADLSSSESEAGDDNEISRIEPVVRHGNTPLSSRTAETEAVDMNGVGHTQRSEIEGEGSAVADNAERGSVEPDTSQLGNNAENSLTP